MPVPKRRKKANEPKKIALNVIEGKAIQYLKYRDDKSAAEKGMKPLSAELKELAEAMGKRNENGSWILKLPNGCTVGKIRKTSESIDQVKALELLTKSHPDVLERCKRTVIDSGELEACIEEGLLGIDEVESITVERESYSIKVDGPKK